MKLEIGKFYENKTRLLLLPCFDLNGPEFKTRFNRLYKFAVGIHDTTLNNHTITEEPLLYILLDKDLSRKWFTEFINWLKSQPYYVTDYVSSPELNSRKHMVVLRIPDTYHSAYQAFMQGKYSEMYSEESKRILFEAHHRKKALRLLDRTYDALLDYMNKVNATFDSELTVANCKEHREYDFPLQPEHEIFNYTNNEEDRQSFAKKYNKSWMEIKVKNLIS